MEEVLQRTECTKKRTVSRKRSLAVSKRVAQKLMGMVLLLICAIHLWLSCTGATVADQDATAVVLLAPLGLWMLLTKDIVIY